MLNGVHTVHWVFFTVIGDLSIITMSLGDHRVKGVNMNGMTFNLVGGGGLAVNTWLGTQPGTWMVLTASCPWLGITGCNWVESKYGHSKQLLIAGANHTLTSLPCFQLFGTSNRDTWISNKLKKLLWYLASDCLSCVIQVFTWIQHSLFQKPWTVKKNNLSPH